MLIVTNIEKVNEIFEKKTPRPIRDVMIEIYPDATEDANGRFHAPFDGYECPITGKTFNAGEYLPENEPEDNYRVVGLNHRYPKAVDLSGNLHEWDGTRAQNIAVWSELIDQTRAEQARNSNYVGEIGKYIEIPIRITYHKEFDGLYGRIHLFIIEDDSKNIIVYKGSSALFKTNTKIDWNHVYKNKFNLRAKIKMHNIREGVKQTIVERPKIMGV